MSHRFDDFCIDNISRRGGLCAISAGADHFCALHKDGFLLSCGNNECGQTSTMHLHRVSAIACGDNHTVAISRGIASAVGCNRYGQCDVRRSLGVKDISCGKNHTVILKRDRSLSAVGDNSCGQCNVKAFRDIHRVRCYENATFGIDASGRIFIAGEVYDKILQGISSVESISDIFMGGTFAVVKTEGGHALIVGDGAPRALHLRVSINSEIKKVLFRYGAAFILSDIGIEIFFDRICLPVPFSDGAKDICIFGESLYFINKHGELRNHKFKTQRERGKR